VEEKAFRRTAGFALAGHTVGREKESSRIGSVLSVGPSSKVGERLASRSSPRRVFKKETQRERSMQREPKNSS